MLGPAAAPIVRLKRDYRYHFVLKSASREKLNALLRTMLGYAASRRSQNAGDRGCGCVVADVIREGLRQPRHSRKPVKPRIKCQNPLNAVFSMRPDELHHARRGAA